MTREEAIRTLNFGTWRDNLNSEMSDADSEPLFEALDMAISALKQQQDQESKPLNGWISVEDRLPEKNQAVLGWYKDNPFAGYTYGVVSWNGKGWVFVYAQRYVTNVTHWMPLPNPPKGE